MAELKPWERSINDLHSYLIADTAYLPMEGDLVNKLKPNAVDTNGNITLATVFDGNRLITTLNRHYKESGGGAISGQVEHVVPGYIHYNYSYSGKSKKVKVTNVKVVEQRNRKLQSEKNKKQKTISKIEKTIHKTEHSIAKKREQIEKIKAQIAGNGIKNIGKTIKESRKAAVKKAIKKNKKLTKNDTKLLAALTPGQYSALVAEVTRDMQREIELKQRIVNIEQEIDALQRNLNAQKQDMNAVYNSIIALQAEYDAKPTPLRSKNARIYNYTFENDWFKTYNLNANVYGKKFEVRYTNGKSIMDPSERFLRKAGSPAVPTEEKMPKLKPMLNTIYGQISKSDYTASDVLNGIPSKVISVSGKFTYGAFSIVVPSIGDDPLQSCNVTCFKTSDSMVIDSYDLNIKVIVSLTLNRNIRISFKTDNDLDFTVKYAIAHRTK